MIKKIMIVFLVPVLLAALNYSLLARNWGGDRYQRNGIHLAEKNLFPVHLLLKFKAEIGLTDVQTEKIEKMHLLHQESAIRRFSDIKVLELKMGSYLKKEPINRQAVEKVLNEIGKMKTDLFIERINFLLDVKDMLTTDQLKKIEKMKNEMRMRRFMKRSRRSEK